MSTPKLVTNPPQGSGGPVTAPQTGASVVCICGHTRAHHTRRDGVYAGLMADYRRVWRCAWTGCGCPEFVAANADSDRDGGAS